MMGVPTHPVTRDLDVPETTFTGPDLTTFLGLDALGLTAMGQHLTPGRAVIECRMPAGFEDPFCKACGAQGVARGTVARRLAHLPVGWRPTQLVVRVRRLACAHCCRVWRQDTSRVAQPRARLTRAAVEWGLRALGLESMSVSRVAQALGISWHTANTAILTRAEQAITSNPHRFEGVEVLGVDEHVWRHTRQGDRYVTVIIDLTPVRDRSGPARLPGVVPGRSKKAFKTWLAQRDQAWRGRVEVVATGRFHRVQERRRRGDPQGPGGDGPLRASSPWQEPSSMSAAAAASTRPPAGGAARETRSTRPDAPCARGPTCSPTPRPSASRPCSPTSATLRSRPPGASTSASSRPTAPKRRAWGGS